MAALAALFNFLALNLALLIFSLPVITLPAAVSAATQALDQWRRDGEDQVVREFLIGSGPGGRGSRCWSGCRWRRPSSA